MNQRGISIIQLLVALGIMSILMAAMSTMFTNQTRETRALRQTLAILDLQKQLTMIAADGSVCTQLLTKPLAKQFDPGLIGGKNPPEFALTRIPISITPGAPVFVEAGKNPSPISSELRVTGIRVASLAGNGDFYTANIQVTFDNSVLIRAHKPITAATILRTSGPANNKTIVSCMPATSTGAACLPSVVPDRLWIKSAIMCTMSPGAITLRILNFEGISDGNVVYRDSQNSNPIAAKFDAITGAFVSLKGDKSSYIGAGCRQNLKDVIVNPENACP